MRGRGWSTCILASREGFPTIHLESKGKKTHTTLKNSGLSFTHSVYMYVLIFLMRVLELCSNWRGVFLCNTVENNYWQIETNSMRIVLFILSIEFHDLFLILQSRNSIKWWLCASMGNQNENEPFSVELIVSIYSASNSVFSYYL